MHLFNVPRDAEGSALPAILMAGFVSFGGILFGYDTGTIGGILAMDFWVKLFGTHINAEGHVYLTTGQQALIVSFLSIGTFVGALGAAPIGDFVGRRHGILIACLVFSLGVILQTVATAIPLFSAGRCIAGLGVGILSSLIPLYQSECSPKWIRGSLIALYQFALTIGLLLAAIVDNATHDRQDSGSYRIPVAVQLLWALILAGGLLYLPETPRFFVRNGDKPNAARSLGILRRLPSDHVSIQEELSIIITNHEYEMSISQSSWASIFQKAGHQRKRLFTGCMVMAGSQLTGINFIFYYGTAFFKNSGIQNPFLISLITNLVNVFSVIPGLYLVEKWGRRPILLFGAVGMTVCEFIVAIAGLTASSDTTNKVLVAFVCFYIFFYSISWGPVGWVVVGEIFPLQLRARSISCSIATNWLFNWALSYATPYLVDSGPGSAGLGVKVFFVWGACCFCCSLFVYFCVYETKGLTLEEVDDLYEHVGKAWRSKGFVPQANFRNELTQENVEFSTNEINSKNGKGEGAATFEHREI